MTPVPKAAANLSSTVAKRVGPVGYCADGRRRRILSLRDWSVRHSALLETVYRSFEKMLVALDPVFRRLGYERMEKPVAFVERGVKGILFDCRMCGTCILSSTGMSCPMNCPKQLRNGPCGGVRENGHCEINPEMSCVWVDAWKGSRTMQGGEAILAVQPPLNQALRETSSWLGVMREKAARAGTAGTESGA